MWADFFYSSLISIVLVVVTTTVFYEVMRVVWNVLENYKARPYILINALILTLFAIHSAAIWLYGATFWVMDTKYSFGSLLGAAHASFLDYVYFSAASYSSLGFGDIFPEGPIRMVASVEVLNGLILIGWSVYFTYLAMGKFWNLHLPRK